MNTQLYQVTAEFLLMYLQFLVFNDTSPAQLGNQLSAIKANFAILNLPTVSFESQKVKYFIRALKLNAPLRVTLKKVIDIPTLREIVRQCDTMYMGQIFKCIYLLSFFSFLRISNLVPHAKSLFSPSRHLTPEDIFFQHTTAVILVKWSKTLQFNNEIKLLHIPMLHNDLCPVAALKNILAIIPHTRNQPLLQYNNKNMWLPLTDNQVRNNLKTILERFNLPPSYFTFHSFRRSGATWAFNHNVPLQCIKQQGTWTSDCVWRYVTDSADAGSQVAQTFAQLLS